MNPTLSVPLLQSSEMDIIMSDSDQRDNTPNGFIHPQDTVLSQVQDLDQLDSTPDEFSREESQQNTETTTFTNGRRFSQLPTGCCYDSRMTLHANADFSASPHHPEDPRRIQAIMKEFQDAGLIYTGSESELLPLLTLSPNRWMYRISARNATREEICLVHTPDHFYWVENLSRMSSSDLRNMTNDMDAGRKSLYVGNLTYQAALISAGGAIETCKNVVAGQCKNGIAVIRPPGHHAEPNESMGFCIFNNVPIAASVCMQDYPEICRKILILDWDVHHGNGIQNMFYENPNVLYISIHVYQNGTFYPGQPDGGGTDGGLDQCGAGKGIGRNVNIGWQEQGMGDSDYMAAFQKIVMPIAQEFDPDLVIVSAGFDAAAGDELGGCFVTPACYSHMTYMLMSLANGKVVVCLEGGYNLRAISRSAVAVAKTLMGEPPERLHLDKLQKQAAHVINEVKLQQAPYWECMRQGTVTRKEVVEQGAQRLDNVLRRYQRAQLNQEFKMVSIYVQRTQLSKTFEDQVLATPLLYAAKKIVLIIHDP
jgi:histone deacetylase 6